MRRCQRRARPQKTRTEDDTSTNVIDANAEGDTNTTWLQTIRNAAIQRTILDAYLWTPPADATNQRTTKMYVYPS